jgi:hypothetical protein
MTKPNYTHIHMLFDRSGSMSGHEADVEGWYKTFIEGLRAQPGDCTVSAAQFDTQGYETTIEWATLQTAPNEFKLYPRGGTPLLDSVAKSIHQLGERLSAMKEEDRPSKVIVVVQTDGEENASVEYTKEKLKVLVKEQTETYSWEFMFLGANIDAFGEAEAMGMRAATTANFGQTTKGYTTSAAVMSAAVNRSRIGQSLAYTSLEKRTLEDTVEEK